MIGTSQLINTFSRPCFTDTTDIFKDGSGVALYGLDYDASDAGGASGKFGEAAIFNGSSSYINLGDPTSGITTANYSISFWVNTTSTSASYLISKYLGDGIDSTDIFRVRNLSDGTISFRTSTSNPSARDITSTSTINDGNWHHILFTVEPNLSKLYINGTEEGSSTTGTAKAPSSISRNVTIGRHDGGDNYFNGKIDQVRIYDSTLTQSQVTQLYQENNSTVGTHLFGCIANYNLDGSAKESMGTTAYDGTETDITYRYDGTPTAVDFGVGGKSDYGARFNGSSSYIDLGTSLLGSKSAFSVSTWVNFANLNTQNFIFYNSESGAGGNVGFYDFGNGSIYFQPDASTSANRGYISNSGIYTTDEWVHIVMVFDGSATGNSNRLKTYIQGTERTLTYDGTIPSSTGTSTANSWIGGRSSTKFSGDIDQVRIFSKALSSAEVGKLYGNGAGEIACAYTSTTDDAAYPIANTAYYKLDNNSKDSARSTGKFNEGAIFNGSSSSFQAGNGISSQGTDLTFSLWFKTNNNNATQMLVDFNYTAGSGIQIYNGNVSSAGQLIFRVQTGGTKYFQIVSASVISNNTWHNVVGTWQNQASGVAKLYLDGNNINTATSTQTGVLTLGSGNQHLGSRNTGVSALNGEIDQVRIYNTVLDSTDVSNLYAETVSDTSTLSFPSGKTAIATYQLDGNSTDLSGNYNGTDTNITYAYDGTESNVEYRFGRYGQAAVFNGTSSEIEVSSNVLNINTISVSAWINLGTTSGFQQIVSNYAADNKGWGLRINDGGYLSYNTAVNVITSSTALLANTWHHVALTIDSSGNSTKLYINGSEDSSTTYTAPTYGAGNTNFHIGSLGNLNTQYFNGSIDQVRIYSTALTSSQVTQLYNEKPEVDTSNFKTVLYTGNGGTQYISNVGFQPDLVWIKDRGVANYHILQDSIRGAGKSLFSNETQASSGNANDLISSFDFNGFTVNRNYNGTTNNPSTNENGATNVAWVWKGGGLLNKSASFNGSSSKIELPTSTFSPSTFSLSAWCNVTSDTDENTILELFDNQTYPNHTTIVLSAGSTTSSSRFLLRNYATNQYNYNPSGTVSKNVWKHYAMTYDGSTVKSYIDGSLVDSGSLTLSNTVGTISSIQIGLSSGSRHLNGSIDQVRVFNKAISASEVTTLYNETASTINTLQVLGDTSCVAAYPLGVGAGDIGNTYSGTPSNVTFNNPGHLTRNNSGTIESTVSANKEAGFSIVKYTGNASVSTVAHGLDYPPEMIVIKNLDNTVAARNWAVYHSGVDTNPENFFLRLNTSSAKLDYPIWNDTAPNSDVFTLGDTTQAGEANDNNNDHIAYCWHSVAGYSKIGSYTGNGSSTGPNVTTGFEPKFIMIKRTDTSGYGWYIMDSARGMDGTTGKFLFANTSASEGTLGAGGLQPNSTGFQITDAGAGFNANLGTYIYMAFK